MEKKFTDYSNIKLKNAELYFDAECNTYFLRLSYLCEDESKISEVIFPKVKIGIPNTFIDIQTLSTIMSSDNCYKIRFYENNWLYLLPDNNGKVFYENTINNKIKTMTLEDIEKKLGYKVRIVSSKEND